LFLDKEIRGINAIQTISRVNRTTKHKNDCKIVDFSYKNVNVKNIKTAFEHFSNVVVSDFDPLGDEAKLEIYYKDLKDHVLLKAEYPNFVKYQQGENGVRDISLILDMQNNFSEYIKHNKIEAKNLKSTINNYFKIINLIEFVIELDVKYSDATFLEFLRKYNNEYNNIHKQKV
jgi:type I restriction enzyme R subunit